MKVLFVVLAVFISIGIAAPANAPRSALAVSQDYTAEDYSRHMSDPNNFVVTPGGNVSYFNVTTNPVLGTYSGIGGNGVAVSIATLTPCGMILPHIHPRGAKVVYIITGKVMVGRIQENKAQPIISVLGPGDITFIPRAAMHFVQSLSCSVSQQLNAYNTEDPGLMTFGINVLRFPDIAMEGAFNISRDQVEYLRTTLPPSALNPLSICQAACAAGLNPADYVADILSNTY